MTNAGIFHHDMRHLIKSKNAQIMVNDSCYPIPQEEENKKWYTAHDVKMSGRARQNQHITGQPIKRILHAVDNNILNYLPILRKFVGMAEEIYGNSVPHLQGKTVRQKIQHVELVMVPSVPKDILDKYKKVILFCDLLHIKGIGFLNIISQHIMFSTGNIMKNWKIKNTEYGIKQVHKLYLQHDSKSSAYMLIASLNLYVRKILILVYPLIVHLRRNMYLRLSDSTVL